MLPIGKLLLSESVNFIVTIAAGVARHKEAPRKTFASPFVLIFEVLSVQVIPSDEVPKNSTCSDYNP